MCLAVPGLVVAVDASVDPPMGRVELGGVARRICFAHVPDAAPGEYVLVHVGFALAKIDAAEAARVFALLEELGQLEEAELE